jgi:hypothetical protein
VVQRIAPTLVLLQNRPAQLLITAAPKQTQKLQRHGRSPRRRAEGSRRPS